jgi:hypothetical protein
MFRFGCSRMDGVSVTAERDWITPSLPERCEDWPLERIVAALSHSLALKLGDRWITALGDNLPTDVRDCLSIAEFAVVFRPVLRY